MAKLRLNSQSGAMHRLVPQASSLWSATSRRVAQYWIHQTVLVGHLLLQTAQVDWISLKSSVLFLRKIRVQPSPSGWPTSGIHPLCSLVPALSSIPWANKVTMSTNAQASPWRSARATSRLVLLAPPWFSPATQLQAEMAATRWRSRRPFPSLLTAQCTSPFQTKCSCSPLGSPRSRFRTQWTFRALFHCSKAPQTKSSSFKTASPSLTFWRAIRSLLH